MARTIGHVLRHLAALVALDDPASHASYDEVGNDERKRVRPVRGAFWIEKNDQRRSHRYRYEADQPLARLVVTALKIVKTLLEIGVLSHRGNLGGRQLGSHDRPIFPASLRIDIRIAALLLHLGLR